MTNEMQEMMPRILRDMNDGVLALDSRGTILYMNQNGRELLGRAEDPAGSKFAAVFFSTDEDSQNDAFTQFVLDAVYDKENTHSGEVDFHLPDGRVRRLRLTSSFLMGEDGSSCGVVLVFSDITEVTRLHRQRKDSSIIFAVLMIFVCSSLFLWSLLRYLSVEPAPWVMNLMIEAISIVMFFIVIKTTQFSWKDIGLRKPGLRTTLIPDLLITLGGTAFLVVAKLAILHFSPDFFPAGTSFWDWSYFTPSDIFYPLTVLLQEFLARSVMQETLRRIFDGRYAGTLSIVVSSLIFGALHVAYGLPLMLGAAVLLGALGVLYHRQRNIWGVSIVHYVLGEVFTFLGFL